MIAFLFRFRGELLACWGLLVSLWCWPPRGSWVSVVPLVAGLGLRAWARRHIGPHSRWRKLACPERSVAGPYRYVRHPLYLANMMVASSLSLALAGPGWVVLAILAGPSCLYIVLARAETSLVRSLSPPERIVAHDSRTGGWRSEWASFAPPLLAWMALQILSIR